LLARSGGLGGGGGGGDSRCGSLSNWSNKPRSKAKESMSSEEKRTNQSSRDIPNALPSPSNSKLAAPSRHHRRSRSYGGADAERATKATSSLVVPPSLDDQEVSSIESISSLFFPFCDRPCIAVTEGSEEIPSSGNTWPRGAYSRSAGGSPRRSGQGSPASVAAPLLFLGRPIKNPSSLSRSALVLAPMTPPPYAKATFVVDRAPALLFPGFEDVKSMMALVNGFPVSFQELESLYEVCH